jgi:hypothetical protein
MATKEQTKAKLDKRIATITKSESTTKTELGAFSREVLDYVYQWKDIGMVNRLLDNLSPVHKRVAYLYFPKFLAWEFDKETKRFTKMFDKEKRLNARREKAVEFLKDPSNNIWSWATANTETTRRPKNYARNLTNTLKNGLAETGDNKLTAGSIAQALKDSGMDLKKLMKACEMFE